MDESQGSKIGTAQEPPATSRPSLRGPYPRDVECLALGQNALNCPNPNPQNAVGVRPLTLGGFRTHATGTTSQSILLRSHLQRETCRNGCGKTTSMIPLIIFVFGEFGGPGYMGATQRLWKALQIAKAAATQRQILHHLKLNILARSHMHTKNKMGNW